MATAVANIVRPDFEAGALAGWQLLKRPTGAQTAPTAAQLMQPLVDVEWTITAATDIVDVLDVERFSAIRFQVLGVASNNHAPVINLYGWHNGGPGHHIGVITLAFGNFTTAATTGFHATAHSSIKERFAPATAYQVCDTYTITSDLERENGFTNTDDNTAAGAYFDRHRALTSPSTTAGAGVVEADFPSYANVDLSRSRYKYLAVFVTALNSATSVGAIWTPICLRKY